MKMLKVLGPGLGVCLMLAGFTAQADAEPQDSATAAGLRIQIDPKTGKKTTAADDSDLARTQPGSRAAAPGARDAAASSRQAADLANISAKLGVPVDSPAPVRNADGSLSARVGLNDMKYLVMTIDQDGKRSVSHRTLDQLPDDEPAKAPDTGEK
jgi:hypothetical protein